MASLTNKMKMIAKRKLSKSGKSRKRRLAKGTTPQFPIHLKAKENPLPKPPGSES